MNRQLASSTGTDKRSDVAPSRNVAGASPCVSSSINDSPTATSYQRRLVMDHVVSQETADMRQKFEALALSLRDSICQQWLKTNRTYDQANPKRVYYLSLEYLIGRSLVSNIANLQAEPRVREMMEQEGLQLSDLAELESDAGLGNGGLGRLAACFIESMATMQIPAVGYGLRYQYGIFRQELQDGYQLELPNNWLKNPDPWEVMRQAESVEVTTNAAVQIRHGVPCLTCDAPMTLIGTPYDRPVIGYEGKTVNTLRLWSATSADYFDLSEFNRGDFFGAVDDKVMAESITRVLYPDDSTMAGKDLRFAQEYFLVACSLADILRRFRHQNIDWHTLPDKVAIHLNDTHPAMAVSELMRVLLDDVRLDWGEAWDITVRTLAYTNHTLLPEALEKWPVELFQTALPRHMEIINEINDRFLTDVKAAFPGDDQRLARMSLIEEGPIKRVRMAHLSVVGTHSTNGVASIHSELLRTKTLKDFAEMFPKRFSNKTNGVTPRRWLLSSNPELSQIISREIGDGWITDLTELRKLLPLAEVAKFQIKFLHAKQQAKLRFADWLKSSAGIVVDPDSIFDCHIKRIHEYKRQLMNVLHIIICYNRLRSNPNLDYTPRTFFFAGKAAPAYQLAKLVIKLINNVAAVIDNDPAVHGRLKIAFLPDYNVSLAERIIPASDVSEQISTAGYEASGTSNMKLMMNGALTVGTRDGATIEMAEAAGEENMFLFGLTAQQVEETRAWYNPRWHYDNEPETREALDLIASDHFSRKEPGIFRPIWDTLLTHGDHYMHLADLAAYTRAHEQVDISYADKAEWARTAITNIACSGKFSSDRTIAEYASEIWGVGPCPVELD